MEPVRVVGIVTLGVRHATTLGVTLGVRHVMFALAAAAAGGVPLWLAARAVPEIDVHTVPWVTHGGRLLERYPLGQGFRCDHDGLRRIDVALVALRHPPRGGALLVLRGDAPDGPVLREVEASPGDLPPPGAFVPFEFEPVADSAGRDFFFELRPGGGVRPGDLSPWVRYRGHVGHDGAWSDRRYEEPPREGEQAAAFELEGRLRPSLPPGVEPNPGDQSTPDDVPHPWLRAVSVAALYIAPRYGEARLELWEEGAEGPPLRTSVLAPEDEIQQGFAFFAFEPIEDSRWRRYRYRLSLPPGSALIGDRWGPTMKTWHGLEGGDPRLLGATAGGAPRPDRDLVFRAWTRPDAAAALAVLAERAGWRLPAAAILWLLASAGAVAACLPRRASGAELAGEAGIPSPPPRN